MIEKNRVMRFDTLDPNDRFVAHIKFPHPVEDMFLFYESLNAEPLMYLFPKIQQEEEQLGNGCLFAFCVIDCLLYYSSIFVANLSVNIQLQLSKKGYQ